MNDETWVASERSAPIPDHAYPPQPEFGDVIDALDDAAASLKIVVRTRARGLLDRARAHVREHPLTMVAAAAGLAWLFGRLQR